VGFTHLCVQAYETNVRHRHRAEEKAARAAEKAAKEEQKRLQDLKSYKTVMKVGRAGGACRYMVVFVEECGQLGEFRPSCKAASTAALAQGMVM
jgi:hypothetical protein